MAADDTPSPSIDDILEQLTYEVITWKYGVVSAEAKAERYKAKQQLLALLTSIRPEKKPVIPFDPAHDTQEDVIKRALARSHNDCIDQYESAIRRAFGEVEA